MRWPGLVRAVLITAVLSGVSACGGGGSSSPPTNPPTNPPPPPPAARTNWDAVLWDTDNWS